MNDALFLLDKTDIARLLRVNRNQARIPGLQAGEG